LEFQKQTIKLMLAIGLFLACGYGALLFHSDVTANTRTNYSKAMFGEPMHDCMMNTFKLENLAKEDDPKLERLSKELMIYDILFLIVQVGILYLGSALIVRRFNKKFEEKNAKNAQHN
jgi:NADH:ubiquinone oxidoreductase subunit 3 (subunit A)